MGIVVGLEDVELKSVLALSSDFVAVTVPRDPIRYFAGTFERNGRKVDVVVAAAPKMGMPVAAVVATKLIAAFRPRYLMMTGICAGVRRKVKLGDAIVADPCWDWGSGKISDDIKGDETSLLAPYRWRLDTDIRTHIRELSEDDTFLADLHERWKKRKPAKAPALHIDALASGAAVVARKKAMDTIRKQHKNLLGVEMEIYAVLTAAEYASAPRPTCMGIKAVCDFGDAKKNDFAHAYAAYVSAECAKEIALRFMAENI
ncbi:hypothetical protein QP185_05920 [Sphingomonas aerolata]|uniref:5'-methylthioadenosine/S-adenosylhomocysteine nucleosidase family protein n=1 Tax=Sphingomonas aerolata TaxID=185951 RepID=UPI002FDF7E7F